MTALSQGEKLRIRLYSSAGSELSSYTTTVSHDMDYYEVTLPIAAQLPAGSFIRLEGSDRGKKWTRTYQVGRLGGQPSVEKTTLPTAGSVRYRSEGVHKISNKGGYTKGNSVSLTPADLKENQTLTKALKTAGVLNEDERVREFRIEGNRVIVFPAARRTEYGAGIMPWHSIILTPES